MPNGIRLASQEASAARSNHGGVEEFNEADDGALRLPHQYLLSIARQ